MSAIVRPRVGAVRPKTSQYYCCCSFSSSAAARASASGILNASHSSHYDACWSSSLKPVCENAIATAIVMTRNRCLASHDAFGDWTLILAIDSVLANGWRIDGACCEV